MAQRKIINVYIEYEPMVVAMIREFQEGDTVGFDHIHFQILNGDRVTSMSIDKPRAFGEPLMSLEDARRHIVRTLSNL